MIKLVFERYGDGWKSRGGHAPGAAKVLGVLVLQDGGEDTIFFWDHNRVQYADDLKNAGYDPIFCEK